MMGCWPVNQEESPGIQSQATQHASTDIILLFMVDMVVYCVCIKNEGWMEKGKEQQKEKEIERKT